VSKLGRQRLLSESLRIPFGESGVVQYFIELTSQIVGIKRPQHAKSVVARFINLFREVLGILGVRLHDDSAAFRSVDSGVAPDVTDLPLARISMRGCVVS
jgi:hypothetical protein